MCEDIAMGEKVHVMQDLSGCSCDIYVTCLSSFKMMSVDGSQRKLKHVSYDPESVCVAHARKCLSHVCSSHIV